MYMTGAIVCIAIMLSIFSTTVMTYIAMATPIGPWIAPTLVLLTLFGYKLIGKKINDTSVALTVSAGSVGGILATAVGFYMPTLYFADQTRFALWLSDPFCFVVTTSLLAGFAGWFGMWCANLAEKQLLDEQKLSFSIGHLVHGMIAAHEHMRTMYELVLSFIGTLFFCLFQDGAYGVAGFIPKSISCATRIQTSLFTVPAIYFDLWPMVWAIGFITGHLIMIPLCIGAAARVLLLDPIHISWFSSLSSMDFVLAFCSGMVVVTTVCGVWDSLRRFIKTRNVSAGGVRMMIYEVRANKRWLLEGLFISICGLIYVLYYDMSCITYIYMLLFGAVCTYQMSVVAGKMGIAPLGQFATFVMMPAMVLLTRDVWLLTLISVFVAASGGVAVDVLFSRRLARLSSIPTEIMRPYQYLGLIISALTVGIVFVGLVKAVPLGSAELFAHKAQMRALLFECARFDIYVLILGGMFGLLLDRLRCNSMLVLGGVLMPLNLSIGLICGGFVARIVNNRERYEACASGIFAANSIWMVIRALIK